MVSPDEGSFFSASSGNDPPERGHAHDPVERDEGDEGAREGAHIPAGRGPAHDPDDPQDLDPTEREQSYGPIGFRRYVKDDGRALILYTHGGPAGGGLAHGGDGSRSAHEGHERA